MKRILAQVRKELTQLWRDRLTLALALVLPVVLLLLLSKATSLSVKDIPVVVQDLDKTPMSRRYLETVSASLSFKLSALPRACWRLAWQCFRRCWRRWRSRARAS